MTTTDAATLHQVSHGLLSTGTSEAYVALGELMLVYIPTTELMECTHVV